MSVMHTKSHRQNTSVIWVSLIKDALVSYTAVDFDLCGRPSSVLWAHAGCSSMAGCSGWGRTHLAPSVTMSFFFVNGKSHMHFLVLLLPPIGLTLHTASASTWRKCVEPACFAPNRQCFYVSVTPGLGYTYSECALLTWNWICNMSHSQYESAIKNYQLWYFRGKTWGLPVSPQQSTNTAMLCCFYKPNTVNE